MDKPLGALENVPLREIWPHEERDFSAWLSDQDNLESLSEELGISLSLEETEKRVGPFEADILATDDSGNLVVIENQLERTNHEHLGKVLTYFKNLDAKTAIWITSEPRAEHEKVVEWLNETTPDDVRFYLVKVEVYRIGDSPPAPKFLAVVSPSQEAKDYGKRKKELSEWQTLLLKFWETLLQRANEMGVTTHDGVNPRKDVWLSTSAGRQNVWLVYSGLMKEKTRVELVIDTPSKELNKKIYDALFAKKGEIEAAFGGPLTWLRNDGKKRSKIQYTVKKGGVRDGEEKWPGIHKAMIEAMDRFARAIIPQVKALDVRDD